MNLYLHSTKVRLKRVADKLLFELDENLHSTKVRLKLNSVEGVSDYIYKIYIPLR